MEKPIFKRLFAYVVDIIIVAVIASLFIDLPIVNPYLDKYIELSESMINYLTGVEVLTQDAINKMQYDFIYYSFYASLTLLIIKALYFIIFQYINGGKTIGKAIFKIEMVSVKKKLKLHQVLISSLIMCNILTQGITLLLLRTQSMNTFLKASNIISGIEMFILMTSIFLILMRKDGRGLHDLISGTLVKYREKERKE